MIKGLILAILINFAITGLWYGFEWIEFGELQWDRECDNFVSFIYFIVLWIILSK